MAQARFRSTSRAVLVISACGLIFSAALLAPARPPARAFTSPAAAAASDSALARVGSLPADPASLLLLPDGTALAGGAQGQVWRSPDSGHIWRRVATLPGKVSRLAYQSGVIVARVHGRLERSRDDGRTWSPVRQPSLVPVVAGPWVSGDSVLALASPVGKRVATAPWPLLSSSDRGHTWRIIARIPARIGSSGATYLAGDHAFAPLAPGYWAALYRRGDCSAPATIALSTTGGRSWQTIAAPAQYERFDRAGAMAVTLSRLVLGGSFCPSTPGFGPGIFTRPLHQPGAPWTASAMPPGFHVSVTGAHGNARGQPPSEAEFSVSAMAFPQPSLGVAVGARRIAGSPVRDLVLTSRDGAGTWRALSLPNLPALNLLSCTGAGRCLLGATTSTAVLSYAPGASPSAGPGENLSAWVAGYLIRRHSSSSLVTSVPVILDTLDGGRTWRTQAPGKALPDAQLTAVSFISATDGWVLGVDEASDAAVLLVTTDRGALWRQEYSLPYRTTGIALTSLAFVNARDGWLAGVNEHTDAPVILASTDGGRTFTAQHPPAATGGLSDVYFVNRLDGWAVGAMILRTTDGGRTWSLEPLTRNGKALTVGLSAVSFVNPRDGWAVGSRITGPTATGIQTHPVILATTDGGRSWTVQNLPAAVATGTLAGVSFVNPRDGWAVGVNDHPPGALILATVNGGRTWVAQKAPRFSMLRAVKFISARTGWAVGDGGGILFTADAGRVWTVQRPPQGTANAFLGGVDARSAGEAGGP